MGVLNQLLIASSSEAPAMLESDDPLTTWDGVFCRGLDRITLTTLCSLLEGRKPYDGLEQRLDIFPTTLSNGTDGPWVDVVPPAMLAALASIAAMDEAEVDSLADQWAATDELEGWDEVPGLLRDLGDKAETADLENKTLLIWTCL